jgi:hypothetical protein
MPLALGIGTGAQLHQPLAIAFIAALLRRCPCCDRAAVDVEDSYAEKKKHAQSWTICVTDMFSNA